MSQCICSTANDLYVAGENHQCENRGFFRVPGELSEYLLGALVCKQHMKYLLSRDDRNPRVLNWQTWAETFKSAGVPKGQRIDDLQRLYTKQAIWSELS